MMRQQLKTRKSTSKKNYKLIISLRAHFEEREKIFFLPNISRKKIFIVSSRFFFLDITQCYDDGLCKLSDAHYYVHMYISDRSWKISKESQTDEVLKTVT